MLVASSESTVSAGVGIATVGLGRRGTTTSAAAASARLASASAASLHARESRTSHLPCVPCTRLMVSRTWSVLKRLRCKPSVSSTAVARRSSSPKRRSTASAVSRRDGHRTAPSSNAATSGAAASKTTPTSFVSQSAKANPIITQEEAMTPRMANVARRSRPRRTRKPPIRRFRSRTTTSWSTGTRSSSRTCTTDVLRSALLWSRAERRTSVVQVLELERVPVLHDVVVRDLNRLIGGFRVRLGLERLATFAIRGVIASSCVMIGLAFALWLTNEVGVVLLAAAPLVAALLLGAVRWPSRRETALAVDRRFGLDERLATAVELTDGLQRSRFSTLQVRDTISRVQGTHGRWLVLDSRACNEAALALASLALAAAALVVVPRLPRPTVAIPTPADTVDSELATSIDDLGQRALPLDISDQALPTTAAGRAAGAPAAG